MTDPVVCGASLIVDGRPSVLCAYALSHSGPHSWAWLTPAASWLAAPTPTQPPPAYAVIGLDSEGRCASCGHPVREHVLAFDDSGRAAAASPHPDGNTYFCHDGSRVMR